MVEVGNSKKTHKTGPGNLVWWRNKFLTGLVVIIPAAATFYILKLLYGLFIAFFEPLVKLFVSAFRESLPNSMVLNDTIPFASLILTILFIILMGLLVTNVFGRTLVHYFENILLRVPLVNIIYPLVKQVVDSVKSIGETAGQLNPEDSRQVVYVKYPGFNGYLLGFQTGRFVDKDGVSFVSVFIPTAPNPITGFVMIFKEVEVMESDLSMEDAWKLLVSAGFVTPLSGKIGMPSGPIKPPGHNDL
ncbi:MAG: DUF502 domain-containing protein [Verrucomicrobiota bacterium]